MIVTKLEITQRDGANVSHSYVDEGLVGDKAFNGFGDFVWNRYGSFSIRLNHIISNGDGATTPAGRVFGK